MTRAGMISGVRPATTRASMAAMSAWKTRRGGMAMVCVAYSGTAANIASRISSISSRLALIGSSQAENDAVPLHRQRHRLVRRLQQRERPEDGALAVAIGAQNEMREGHDQLEIALQRVVRRRRCLADHPFEVVVARAARLVRIDHHVHGAPRIHLGLLDDPAPEAGGFLPGHMAERVAAHVVAKRMHLVAGAGTMRGKQLPLHGTEPVALHGWIEQLGIDDDLAVDAHAALLQEKAEGIARV